MEDLGGVISKEGGGWSKDCRWEVDSSFPSLTEVCAEGTWGKRTGEQRLYINT